MLLKELKFVGYRFTVPRTWEEYPYTAGLCSRLVYKFGYAIIIYLYPRWGKTTWDKLHARRGKETVVKLLVSITRNIWLLNYVMSISIFFSNRLSRMGMFTCFWFFIMMIGLDVDNWVSWFKPELLGQALWRKAFGKWLGPSLWTKGLGGYGGHHSYFGNTSHLCRVINYIFLLAWVVEFWRDTMLSSVAFVFPTLH